MMVESGGDFLTNPEQSHNVALDGNFSIQVLQKALEVSDLHVIPLDNPDAGPAQTNPELETAYICHLESHWFCIRRVNGSLKASGWSIFLVRGNFPKEFPMALSHSSFGYGQWLTPEDAAKILKSSNSNQRAVPRNSRKMMNDDDDLKAAIAASLRDSGPPVKRVKVEDGTPDESINKDEQEVQKVEQGNQSSSPDE
ncbi:hypothetical protein OROHE_013355 [Orobanche hederae]